LEADERIDRVRLAKDHEITQKEQQLCELRSLNEALARDMELET